MKSPRLAMATTNHTARAMMSLEPVKRVFAVLATTAPLALFPSVSDRFMHLSLTQKRRKTQRLRGVSVFFSHIISYLRAQVTALACSLPRSYGVALAHWSRAELARHAATIPTLPTIGPRTIERWLTAEQVRATSQPSKQADPLQL